MAENRPPVVFVHGLWLHATSWQPWAELFAEHGYEPHLADWPGERPTVEETRENGDAMADRGIDDVFAHLVELIKGLDRPPVLIGHSFGGLFVEKLLGENHGVGGIAIDAAQIKGVLPLPLSALRDGWRFELRHLHLKSGSLSPFKRFAFELRDIVRRQPLPGYVLSLEVEIGGRTLLAFEPLAACGKPVDGLVLSGTRTIVPSGTRGSCYQEPKSGLRFRNHGRNRALNLESNQESNSEERARDVENLIRTAARNLRATGKAPALEAHSTQAGRKGSEPLATHQLPLCDRPGGAR